MAFLQLLKLEMHLFSQDVTEIRYWSQLISFTVVPLHFAGSQRPTYPSSRATKDWDKLEAQMKKEVYMLSLPFLMVFSFALR